VACAVRGAHGEKRAKRSSALQRLSSQNSLPLLTIGTQQLKGFGDTEWSQYLDAAGYPKSNSQLPAGYGNALGPGPWSHCKLQAAARPAAAAAPAAQPAQTAASSPPHQAIRALSNPAGIKF
jgi:hypothetical protein